MTIQRRTLQRVVMPLEPDFDVLPLYVTEGSTNRESDERVATLAGVRDRTTYEVVSGRHASFGTYFAAFPASYWRRWTTVTNVRLEMSLSGVGTVLVYRSNAKGNKYRIHSHEISGESSLIQELPLKNFADGGWYWFEVVAGADASLTVSDARWTAESDVPLRSATIGITTLNRPDDVSALLTQYGSDRALLSQIDEVVVVDQGTQHPEDADGFEHASDLLGNKLRMIRQPNLGGSGGFSRAMYETLTEDRSTYLLISDDDVRAEPEGVLRAIAFADLSRQPTIVGGQMFSMFDRTFLHSMGEKIQPWRFWWGPVIEGAQGHHLDQTPLLDDPVLHRRVDVDYNGWWMTLIPVSVLRALGLSLPLFIKWDDAEYGLRAKEAGIPTVTLPGVAVWHVPWTDKDDSLDWQAYYHERNRLVAALIHSRYPRGGRLIRESLVHQIRHLLAAQYSVAELRNRAVADVLRGPDHLHDELATTLSKVRSIQSQFSDAHVEADPQAFPPIQRDKLPKKGRDSVDPPRGYAGQFMLAIVGALRALTPIRPAAQSHPEAHIPATDAQWWMLAHFDSAIVSTSDGTGAVWYKRNPRLFRHQLLQAWHLHRQFFNDWAALQQSYRQAAPRLTSSGAWKKAFGLEADG